MEHSAILSPPLEKQSIRSLSTGFPGKFHLKKIPQTYLDSHFSGIIFVAKQWP
jgi:hypothetical protein